MAYCSILNDIEPRTDKMMKYAGDFDKEVEEEVVSKNMELLVEILETFRQDRGFRVSEMY